MSTSGVYTYSTNQTNIITGACRKIGILGDFETLSTSDPRYVAAQFAINPLVKQYMAFGMPVWSVRESTIPMNLMTTYNGYTIAVGNTYTSNSTTTAGGPVPLKVIQALRLDNTSSISVPLNIYTYEDYEILSNKLSTGAPVHCFYQPLRNTGVLKVWPLPDSYWTTNGSLYIRYQAPYQDFTTGTDEPDFPIEWTKALTYGLAYDLAPEYGVDPTQRNILKGDRDEAIETCLSFGTEEGGFFMQPRFR